MTGEMGQKCRIHYVEREKQVEAVGEIPVISNLLPPVDIEDSCKYLKTFLFLGNIDCVYSLMLFIFYCLDDQSEESSKLTALVYPDNNAEVNNNKAELYPKIPAIKPEPVTNFNTSRMLLSQLGFTDFMVTEDINSCVELDTKKPEFWEDLKILDKMSSRTGDTMYVYYVRSGQEKGSDILANNVSSTLPSEYLQLLSSIGWQVEVKSHLGWTGVGGSKSSSHILYWGDDTSELAILVPCTPVFDLVASTSDQECPQRRVTLNCSTAPELSRLFMSRRSKKEKNFDHLKVVVAWFENMEDSERFPLKKLIPNTNSISLIIYLQPLKNQLLKIRTVGVDGRKKVVVPLVDGALVSQSVVGNLLRQTALNVCRRERLETDSSQYHRRNAIHNIETKYAVNNKNVVQSLVNMFQ